jgi:hypothetical protein
MNGKPQKSRCPDIWRVTQENRLGVSSDLEKTMIWLSDA